MRAHTGTIVTMVVIMLAALAVGVILQPQTDALAVGSRADTNLSSTFTLLSVSGIFDQELKALEVVVQVNPESFDVDLSRSTVEVFANNVRYVNEFAPNCNDLGANEFSVQYPNGQIRPGFITSGQVGELCVAVPGNIRANETLSVDVIPGLGEAVGVELRVPVRQYTERVFLWPN